MLIEKDCEDTQCSDNECCEARKEAQSRESRGIGCHGCIILTLITESEVASSN